jgi:outer membrane immunogenic protein
MGGLRGRLGYLISPTWLLYGAGGLAFGGVHAATTQNFTMEQTWIPVQPGAPGPGYPGLPGTTVYPTISGSGQYSSTRVGWAAGGGMEWMAMPNWSVKAEALYYDLGGASFISSPAVALDPVGYWGAAGAVLASNALRTRVAYDGVIARVGLNYHFNWSDSISSGGTGQPFAAGQANAGGAYWNPRFNSADSGSSAPVARSVAADRANTGKQFWDPRFW